MSVATQLALGECGVAVVAVPGDVTWSKVEGEEPPDFTEGRPTLTPPESDLVRAAELIDSAGKVTTFAAAGCADPHDELMALAGRSKAPVVHTLRGKQFVGPINPYGVGMTGLPGVSLGY